MALEPNPLFDHYLPLFRQWFAESPEDEIATLLVWYRIDPGGGKNPWDLLPPLVCEAFDRKFASAHPVDADTRIIIVHSGNAHGWDGSLASCRRYLDLELKVEPNEHFQGMGALDSWAVILFHLTQNGVIGNENGGRRIVLDKRHRNNLTFALPDGTPLDISDGIGLHADECSLLGNILVQSANEFGFYVCFNDLRVGIIETIEYLQFAKQQQGNKGTSGSTNSEVDVPMPSQNEPAGKHVDDTDNPDADQPKDHNLPAINDYVLHGYDLPEETRPFKYLILAVKCVEAQYERAKEFREKSDQLQGDGRGFGMQSAINAMRETDIGDKYRIDLSKWEGVDRIRIEIEATGSEFDYYALKTWRAQRCISRNVSLERFNETPIKELARQLDENSDGKSPSEDPQPVPEAVLPECSDENRSNGTWELIKDAAGSHEVTETALRAAKTPRKRKPVQHSSGAIQDEGGRWCIEFQKRKWYWLSPKWKPPTE